jgi:hypothetical protein
MRSRHRFASSKSRARAAASIFWRNVSIVSDMELQRALKLFSRKYVGSDCAELLFTGSAN